MKRILIVSALTAGIVAVTTGAAYASQYIAYEGPGFTGRSVLIDACGPSDIPFGGSYKWYGDGQAGRMYNQPGTRGPMHFKLPADDGAEQRSPVGWKSIFIEC
ncbi:MiAMP1 family antimicrobial peptide [Streptosporangium carneum]|uniref:MiAMP1 protein n=1 Tax=Streptosporangium carneum TaxID=47481 RepID=A0A9W6ID14_9ACTN|nr:MiAMP1 family antimicrobial peptide [Streptosporangium carneum]GLK15245.1 hypothetical protein GCM10017600_86580 [Streptosporangium carneum]